MARKPILMASRYGYGSMATRPASTAPMDYAFIVDPLPEIKAFKDLSVAIMRALAARDHRICALEQSDVFWDGRGTQARVVPRPLRPDEHD